MKTLRDTRLRGPSSALLALFSLFGASMLGDNCSSDIVNDPTFREWCGSTLCAWNVDKGKIVPAPTWNENDLGVSFVEPGTLLSQSTSTTGEHCILFTAVADIDVTAQMTFEIDLDDDGTIEYAAPLAAVAWEKVQTEVTLPADYYGLGFHIRKAGTGTAVLAEMRVQSTSGCTGQAVAIAKRSLVVGQACGAADVCREGLICPTAWGSPRACSECVTDDQCRAGTHCEPRAPGWPLQCAPGEGLGFRGAPCVAASDCGSGRCEGATIVATSETSQDCDLASTSPNALTGCDVGTLRGGTCE